MLSLVLTPCTLGQSASFDGVGHLPGGGEASAATAVSGDGSVVVGLSDSANSIVSEAFRWTSSGGIVGMGDLPGDPFRSGAYGVSSNGAVIAGFGYIDEGDNSHAFRWTSSGGMVDLGSLAGDFCLSYSDARGMSADGTSVVGVTVSGDGAPCNYEAFRWTSGGGMVGLGDLPGGPFESQAKGASSDGSVVVGIGRVANGFFEAFRWTADGGMVGLGDLPGGSVHSDAHAVTADGAVVVGVSNSGNFEAYRWTFKGGMVGLGSVGSGSSFAHAVTADGSIVVGSYLGNNGPRAAYWTAEDGMVDLRDRLVNDYDLGLDLAGWTLTQAWGISDDGLTIVGRGINESGDIEGWVAQLPVSKCFGDVDGDGNVGASDLLALLAAWGTDPGGPPDFDGDGNVGASDLLALLSSWGPCA